MKIEAYAERVVMARKSLQAQQRMPVVDRMGVSTKPWGPRRVYGVGFGAPSGPSQRALDTWQRQTGTNLNTARRRREMFRTRF